MDEARAIAVSPRHTVLLAVELFPQVEKPAKQDFVVRTRARREANGLPLMTAELVIAGAETRRTYPAADTFPLHFRKTYFPGRLHGDPQVEYERQLRASELCATPPPIGYAPNAFRSCLVPGQSYARLTPFGGEPPENNIAKAQTLPLATAAGLWRLAEATPWGNCCCCTRAGSRTETPSCTTSSCARRRSNQSSSTSRRRCCGRRWRPPLGKHGATALRSLAAAARGRLPAVPARPAVEPPGRALLGADGSAVQVAGSISARHRRASRGLIGFQIAVQSCELHRSVIRLFKRKGPRKRGRNADDPNSWSIVPSG